MTQSLADMHENQVARITGLARGREFQSKMRSLGIREGKAVRLLSRHPFRGPLVIEIDGRATTLGRGMAQNIIVEPL